MTRFRGVAGRHLMVSIAAGSMLAQATVADGAARFAGMPDPLGLYGPVLEFDVLRNGNHAGTHTVRFERSGNGLGVSSRFVLEVDILFFTAFRYVYQSDGRWRDGRLVSLRATVDDNGRRSIVDMVRDRGATLVRTSDGRTTVNGSLFPTNHWNVAVLSETRVLNTLTGRINDVRIEPRGREAVTTERGEVMATRYAYTGDLEAEVWYDDAGRWVKLRFKARGGSVVEYMCRRCQGLGGFQAHNG